MPVNLLSISFSLITLIFPWGITSASVLLHFSEYSSETYGGGGGFLLYCTHTNHSGV